VAASCFARFGVMVRAKSTKGPRSKLKSDCLVAVQIAEAKYGGAVQIVDIFFGVHMIESQANRVGDMPKDRPAAEISQ
jgi:hypothetical protein